ncbi:unnamed protein product, partial [Meganyctiphanes norvegica]
MATVAYLVVVAVLILLGEPGLGIEDDLHGQERELEDARSNFVDGPDNSIPYADVMLFGSSNRRRKCRQTRRCAEEGGTCQPRGTCKRNPIRSCSGRKCTCCLKEPCNMQKCSYNGTDGVCAPISNPPGSGWIHHGPCEGGDGCECY